MARVLPVCCNDEQLEGEGSGENERISVYGLTSTNMVPLEGGVPFDVDSVRRNRRITILHEEMKIVVGPVQDCKPKESFLKNQKDGYVEERTVICIVIQWYF